MSRTHKLGDLQLAILRVLWQRGEAAVADVHAELQPDRGLALTTIATMLRKLEEKGVVKHRENGRQFLYRPVVAAEQVQARMVGDLVDKLFGGDPLLLVNHLLREGEIAADELEGLRAQIEGARQRRKGGRS
ncbi:MAG TPA: BlaI/MecI/CopY family transcriptional regulator [Planctomycetota bacterium]|nr:BlaI/MecI/CopY family transcriptional regulator [Planctomycetota bacterium]